MTPEFGGIFAAFGSRRVVRLVNVMIGSRPYQSASKKAKVDPTGREKTAANGRPKTASK
jgi:hypothetical protein